MDEKDYNVVHVNFQKPKTKPKPKWEFEISTPWMLRLLAVISVLILSLLIF